MRRVHNPPNRFSSEVLDWLDNPPELKLEVFEEHAKSIVSKNTSPDLSFEFSINPYRGCHHGCAYCYARPTHQYIDFGAGTDFERKIVVKVNAPELLYKTFMKKSWCGERLVFSGVTDCYQPIEAQYKITRKCLEVCEKFANPVGIITKGALIRRDIDLLQSLNEKTNLKVYISIAFSDDAIARKIEPYVPRPKVRFDTIEALAKAGISVGVSVSPLIPGLNHDQISSVLERAADCGATTCFMTLLRLPGEVKDVFSKNIEENFPTRYKKITNQIRAMRNDELSSSTFGDRMVGSGEEWRAIQFVFNNAVQKFGFNKEESAKINPTKVDTFRRPGEQMGLL